MALKYEQVYQNLATMVQAGLSLQQALTTAVAQDRGALAGAMQRVAEGVSQGNSIADGMDKEPRVFAAIDRRMVRLGEESGRLDVCLRMLADWHAFRRRLRQVLWSGLAYPLLVLHLAAFILPIPSFVLSNMTIAGYLLSVAGILAFFYVPVLAILLIRVLAQPGTGLRAGLDAVLTRVPLLGTALRDLALSRFCRSFGLLFEAGVPVLSCAEYAQASCENAVVARYFQNVPEQVRKGDPVSSGFAPQVPAESKAIWCTGEESGRLSESCERLADMYADRATFMLQQLARWLPRILYFLLVAGLALQIIRLYAGVVGQWNDAMG